MVRSTRHNQPLLNNNFAKRTLSAAIGGPLAVGAILAGTPWVETATFLLTAILLWEWSNLSGLPFSHPINSLVGTFMIWAAMGTHNILPLALIVIFGFGFIGFYHYKIGTKLVASLLLLSGPLYIGLGMATLLVIGRSTPLTLLWGLLIVWTTDTAAYITGTVAGGPKLIPRISPGKTWAGLIGGTMAGSAMGVTIAPYCQIHCTPESVLIGLAIVVTLVAHVGDILESAAKRLFKAKESGHLIPGHGGLLDRMDSLLLVGLFLKIIQYFKVL